MILRSDLFWGYLAQFLNIGLGLILMPFIVYYLNTEEVGLWFVFLTLVGLAQLLDMGLGSTLVRNISYVYGGAQSINPHGLENIKNGPLNLDLLSDLVGSAKYIYRLVSMLAAILLFLGGTLYILTILPDGHNNTKILIGWLTFVLGNIITFYYGYLNVLLQGRGEVTFANKVIIASRSIHVIVSIVLLIMGFGLLGLGVASLTSTITCRWLANRYVYSAKHPEMKNLVFDKKRITEVIKILWFNASKLGIVLVGSFLIWKGNILVASSFLGLKDAASYGLAIQIFVLLNTISTVPFFLSLPQLNSLRAQRKEEQAYQLFSSNLVLAIMIYTFSAISVFFLGDYILNQIGSSTRLPSNLVLLCMILVFFLEINHGTCATFITTGNQIPFVRAAIYTGTLVVLSSIFLAPIYGMLGLILSQGFFQLVYNNWKWPKEVGKIFNVSYLKLIMDGFLYLRNRNNIAL